MSSRAGEKSNRTFFGRVTSAIQNTDKTFKFVRRKASSNSEVRQHVMSGAPDTGGAVAPGKTEKSAERHDPIPAANRKYPGQSGPEPANQGKDGSKKRRISLSGLKRMVQRRGLH